MTFKVIQLKDGTLTSATTTPGTNRPLIEDVTVEENPVRAGLTSDTSPDELNFSEALVVHAMSLTQDKEMAELKLSVGLDLSQVRSAKTYTIGKKTGFGSATIVEARDANGQPLGSFLGGFLVGACQ
jgi:hypothetical protein